MMAKKQCPDFALIAGAMARNQQMAEQVCRLIEGGEVTEAEGRKMLKLIGEGKLSSPSCSHWWPFPITYPYTPPLPPAIPYNPWITASGTTDNTKEPQWITSTVNELQPA